MTFILLMDKIKISNKDDNYAYSSNHFRAKTGRLIQFMHQLSKFHANLRSKNQNNTNDKDLAYKRKIMIIYGAYFLHQKRTFIIKIKCLCAILDRPS